MPSKKCYNFSLKNLIITVHLANYKLSAVTPKKTANIKKVQ